VYQTVCDEPGSRIGDALFADGIIRT